MLLHPPHLIMQKLGGGLQTYCVKESFINLTFHMLYVRKAFQNDLEIIIIKFLIIIII